MRFAVSVATLLVLALAASAAEPAVWPRYNGPNGDGWSPATGLNKDWKAKAPAERWRTALGDKGYAGASCDGTSVYIVDHDGEQDLVRAIDLEKASETWRFAYPDNSKENYGFARATPAIAGGRVYTLGRLGQLHCLDAKTGAKVWNLDIAATFKGKAPQWQYAASPIVVGKTVIVAPGGANASVVALDAATGKTVWTGGGSDKPGYATPVVHGKELMLMTGERLLALDPASGKELWSFVWKTKYDVNSSTPLSTDAGIFITSGYGTGCAMVKPAGSTAKEVWKNTLVQSHMNSPVLHDGAIYCTSDPNALVCLDAKTGKENWRQKGFGKGGLMAVDGCLIVTEDKSGETALVALDATAYRELGRVKPFKGGGDFWTQPVVAAGRLILRSKSELVCLDLR